MLGDAPVAVRNLGDILGDCWRPPGGQFGTPGSHNAAGNMHLGVAWPPPGRPHTCTWGSRGPHLAGLTHALGGHMAPTWQMHMGATWLPQLSLRRHSPPHTLPGPHPHPHPGPHPHLHPGPSPPLPSPGVQPACCTGVPWLWPERAADHAVPCAAGAAHVGHVSHTGKGVGAGEGGQALGGGGEEQEGTSFGV